MMPLYAQTQLRPAQKNSHHTPPCWLVWLHGFFGDRREWQQVARALPDYPQLFIDLPGHGGSATIQVNDFAAVSQRLDVTLVAHNISRYWLIGYSLGGRIAMYHACHGNSAGLSGLIVEGSHPGLTDPVQRQARLQSDEQWVQRLHQQPLHQLLTDWYCQPVFASLSHSQRQQLIALRTDNQINNLHQLAGMLQATSLGRQPDLRPALTRLTIPFYYLCGEYDSKFRALAQSLTASYSLITAAGHNAHWENPQQVAQHVAVLLRQHV